MAKAFTALVRNRSSRHGTRPSLIVLHTTEGHNRAGTSDLIGLANWFDNPAAQSSSHVGIDAEGNKVRMVPDGEKAWTQANFNPQALSIEQVGFASKSKRFWITRYHRGLRAVAEQVADWSIKYNIPLKHSTSRGVCQHSDLGAAGGGHHDCGPGYPFKYVLYWARLIAWRKKGRKGGWRQANARRYKNAVLRQQRRYAGKHLGT